MPLRSEYLACSVNRRKDGGFTLLETIIAFAILSLVIVASYATINQILDREKKALASLEASEMASSILEEYIVTKDTALFENTYRNTWSWNLSEHRVPPIIATRFDNRFNYTEIKLELWKLSTPKVKYNYQTVHVQAAN